MTSADSFRDAAGMNGGHTGGHIMGQTGSSPVVNEVEKHAEKPLLMISDDPSNTHGIAPAGIEPTAKL